MHLAYDVGESLLIDEHLQMTTALAPKMASLNSKKNLLATLLDTLYFLNSVIGLKASAMYFKVLAAHVHCAPYITQV
jgi:hypothetical protein